MPHSRFITALCKKNAGTILFLNDNSLMHLGRNDCNFRAYCKFGKSEIAKINLFHFGPKTAKNLKKKAKERHYKQDFCMSYTGRIILVYFSYM